MYYEEKLIKGVLMFRITPDGGWKQCSITGMSERIVKQKQRIAELTEALEDQLTAAEIDQHPALNTKEGQG